MGKFSGYVICSDIDGTLITTKHQIHPKNLEAIRFFRQNGGKFTLATGRMPKSVEQFIPQVQPDYPVIVLNGCGIYDFKQKQYLWVLTLEEDSKDVAEEIMHNHPESGVAIVNAKDTFFLNDNESARYLREVEGFTYHMGSYETVEKPWIKFVFCQKPEYTVAMREAYRNSPYAQKYKMVQSGAPYFEFFNRAANKGAALKRLSQMCGFSLERTAAIGDNENDLEMVKTAHYKAAVTNANPILKNAADIITVCNDEGSVADLIYKLDGLL